MSTSRTKSNWKLSEFVAHSSSVNCLVLSQSNGRMLATGGDDRRVNLWSLGKPNNVLSISGITSPVQSVAFNSSENWIGAGSKSGVIKVFDLEEKKTVRTISGHKAAISSLDFHRYGDILATGSMDTNLKVWDVRRKGCIFTYKGHTEAINDIQFSPDGKWVVSASNDHTVKLWDLSAGRMVADFKAHSGPVTSIRFHPKEFLMVTGSGDRTAKFWDLEKFEVVSEISPESNAIRRVLFHHDGSAMFTGTQESLRVHGWEPPMTYDILPLRWGKLADMAISGDQLIGASIAQTTVSIWCVDLKSIKPYSNTSESTPSSQTVDPTQLTASGRRRFEYQELASERPHTQASSHEGKPVSPEESSDETSGGETGGESPPSEVRDEERKQIFLQRQKLVRTPPKQVQVPFRPPSGEGSPPRSHHAPSDPPHHQPPQSHTVTKHNHARATVEPAQPIQVSKPVSMVPSSQSVVRGSERQSQRSRVDQHVKDFMPPKPVVMGGGKSPESRAMGEIVTNHSDVTQILNSRLSVLKGAREGWSLSDPKAALETVVNSGNQSALVDILSVLHLKRTLWTLDMTLIVLPELKLLMKSKYSMYVTCGCKILKLILKSFGPVIKSNISIPLTPGGVDLMREERYEKCHTCYSHLVSLRDDILQLHRDPSAPVSSKVIREQGVVDAFSVLD